MPNTNTPGFIPMTRDTGTPEEDAQLQAEIALLEATPAGTRPTHDLPPEPGTSSSVTDDAIRAMRAELAALHGELATVKNTKKAGDLLDENASTGGYPWRYYRIPPNWPDVQSQNWIAYGPGGVGNDGAMDAKRYAHYMRKGMRAIDQYGFPDVPTTTSGTEPFLKMLESGGAKEFPCSQVIAYRWHLAPPIKGLTFPQYEENKHLVRKLTCASCGKVDYFMATDATAGDSYRRHLTQVHKYPFEHAAAAVEKAGFRTEPYQSGVTGIDGVETPPLFVN